MDNIINSFLGILVLMNLKSFLKKWIYPLNQVKEKFNYLSYY